MRNIVESFRLHEAKRVNELLRVLTVYMTYTNVPFPLAPFPTCTSAGQGQTLPQTSLLLLEDLKNNNCYLKKNTCIPVADSF